MELATPFDDEFAINIREKFSNHQSWDARALAAIVIDH
jgi:hypothetical protein